MKINSNCFTDLEANTNPQNSEQKACGLEWGNESSGKIYKIPDPRGIIDKGSSLKFKTSAVKKIIAHPVCVL